MTARSAGHDGQGTLSMFQSPGRGSPQSGIGYAGAHVQGEATEEGWRALADVAEVKVTQPAGLVSASLVRGLLHAGEAFTVDDALERVLAVLVDELAAHLAVVWLPLGRGSDGAAPVVCARRAVDGGSESAPEVTAALATLPVAVMDTAIGREVAPRDVVCLPLVLGSGRGVVGRVWVAFARAGAVDGALERLEVAREAAALALGTVLARDEAERARAEARSHAKRADEAGRRWDSLLGLVPDAVVLGDGSSGLVLQANEAARQRYAGGGDLAGRTLRDLALLEQTHARHALAAGASPQPRSHTRRVHTELRGQPAQLLLVQDLEPLREREALVYGLHRDATVGRLASGVVREIASAQALLESDLASLRYELSGVRSGWGAEDHLRASEALLAHAMEVAASVRTTAGGMIRLGSIGANPTRRAEVNEVVEAMVALVSPQLSRRAAVVCDLAPVPPVPMPAGRLGLVVLNLLVNAAHALPDGHPEAHTVRVEVRAEGSSVVLTVQDDGCGMSHDRLERVFEPFFTTKPVGVGVGLGLTICKEIVTQATGVIEVASEVGRGTTVRVSLPGTSRSVRPSIQP